MTEVNDFEISTSVFDRNVLSTVRHRENVGVFLEYKPSTLLPTIELVGPPGPIPHDIRYLNRC